MITFGIPCFNRAIFLEPLVTSIFETRIPKFEILIVEDHSPQRNSIRAIAHHLIAHFNDSTRTIRYVENDTNVGYDKNLKEIIKLAVGEVIVFLGNDDLVNPSEMTIYAGELSENPVATVFLRGYTSFEAPEKDVTVTQIVKNSRIADRDRDLTLVYRYAGAISGFAIRRSFAESLETEVFDGGLYYQTYLTFAGLATAKVFLSETVPVRCRRNIPPDFGSSPNEPDFTVGRYDIRGRVRMLETQLAIAEHFSSHFDEGFMCRYREAISQNIAPIIGEVQHRKWINMPHLYLKLLEHGIGWNARSITIVLTLLLVNKKQASKIFNWLGRALRGSSFI